MSEQVVFVAIGWKSCCIGTFKKAVILHLQRWTLFAVFERIEKQDCVEQADPDFPAQCGVVRRKHWVCRRCGPLHPQLVKIEFSTDAEISVCEHTGLETHPQTVSNQAGLSFF